MFDLFVDVFIKCQGMKILSKTLRLTESMQVPGLDAIYPEQHTDCEIQRSKKSGALARAERDVVVGHLNFYDP